VTVSLSVRQGYKHMVNNLTLARRFGSHLESLGRRPAETDETMGSGSTDMGDISHAVPSIHPWVAICERNETTCHQHAFEACAGSERGASAMLIAAKAMALTTADLLRDAGLLAAVRQEFEAGREQA